MYLILSIHNLRAYGKLLGIKEFIQLSASTF